MSTDPNIINVKIVKPGDHVHLRGPGPLAGRGVTILSVDDEWATVDAGKYGHIGCAVDDLRVPDCSHCCDDPPHGHRCPSCGRVADEGSEG